MKRAIDSFATRTTLALAGVQTDIYSLSALAKTFPRVAQLPYSLKILLENLLRHEDGAVVKADDIRAARRRLGASAGGEREIAFMPARVLLQDFTGVPAVVDLAAMRDAIVRLGGDPTRASTRCSRWNWSSTTRCRSTNSAGRTRSS